MLGTIMCQALHQGFAFLPSPHLSKEALQSLFPSEAEGFLSS